MLRGQTESADVCDAQHVKWGGVSLRLPPRTAASVFGSARRSIRLLWRGVRQVAVRQSGECGKEGTARPAAGGDGAVAWLRSEEHTSELQSLRHLVCRLLLEKKKKTKKKLCRRKHESGARRQRSAAARTGLLPLPRLLLGCLLRGALDFFFFFFFFF